MYAGYYLWKPSVDRPNTHLEAVCVSRRGPVLYARCRGGPYAQEFAQKFPPEEGDEEVFLDPCQRDVGWWFGPIIVPET